MNTIKKIMKNVSAAAIAVMLMGGVFAFATQSNKPEPNMFHNGTEWVPIPLGADYECDDAATSCVGYSPDLSEPDPETIEEGEFTLK